MSEIETFVESEILGVSVAFRSLAAEQSATIARIAEACIASLKAGGKVLFCGNGGSAADSQHLAAELIGRYKLNRPAIASVALTTDTSILTALGNDYGYDTIFARQVEGLGKAGDVLIGLSTSGNSKNVLLAFEKARELGVTTVSFTGAGGGAMAQAADIALRAPSGVTNHIQEMHITSGHLICELIERALYGGQA